MKTYIRKINGASTLPVGGRHSTRSVFDPVTSKQAVDKDGDLLVEDIPFTAAEEAALDKKTVEYEKTERPKRMVSFIKAEAERRIENGVLINGVQFRCTEPSINRVMGMAKRAEIIEASGGNFTQTFTTSAGVVVTLNSALEATGVFIKASGHVSSMLEKSSLLQTSVAAMTLTKLKAFDASLDKHWA